MVYELTEEEVTLMAKALSTYQFIAERMLNGTGNTLTDQQRQIAVEEMLLIKNINKQLKK